jgi:hypothetical protein
VPVCNAVEAMPKRIVSEQSRVFSKEGCGNPIEAGVLTKENSVQKSEQKNVDKERGRHPSEPMRQHMPSCDHFSILLIERKRQRKKQKSRKKIMLPGIS